MRRLTHRTVSVTWSQRCVSLRLASLISSWRMTWSGREDISDSDVAELLPSLPDFISKKHDQQRIISRHHWPSVPPSSLASSLGLEHAILRLHAGDRGDRFYDTSCPCRAIPALSRAEREAGAEFGPRAEHFPFANHSAVGPARGLSCVKMVRVCIRLYHLHPY